MNEPPSGSITFSSFGVTAASVAAGMVQTEGTVRVKSALMALLVTAVGAGLTQRAKHWHLYKESSFKIKYDGRIHLLCLEDVHVQGNWIFYEVKCGFPGRLQCSRWQYAPLRLGRIRRRRRRISAAPGSYQHQLKEIPYPASLKLCAAC